MTLIREKVEQATALLQELDLDLWLTLVRETSGLRDPLLDYLLGPGDLTWPSALLLHRSGRRIAIVGRFEADAVRRLGLYDTVTAYDESLRPPLLEVLDELQPRQIAVNTSPNDVHADGLTHGLYQLLSGYLEGTPHAGKLVSSEPAAAALRGRKTAGEIERIRRAVAATAEIYRQTLDFVHPGMHETEVGAFMHRQMEARGVGPAWNIEGCPMVNSGPDSPVGHGGPTEIVLAPGHLLHFDFGVRQDDYCSDIQRMAYLLRPGEQRPPGAVQSGFETVQAAIQAAFAALRPGVTGQQVDAAARSVVTGAGHPEYMHATGHQLGRLAHDGGALLGPAWERYGQTPFMKVEAGQVYTLELGVAIPGHGYVGLEEDVLVTPDGAEFLGEPQRDLYLIGG